MEDNKMNEIKIIICDLDGTLLNEEEMTVSYTHLDVYKRQ